VSAIADLADVEFCYLTTTGRGSGQPHRIEIWFVAHDDGAYLLSNSLEADWYRNLEAQPRVGRAIFGAVRQYAADPLVNCLHLGDRRLGLVAVAVGRDRDEPRGTPQPSELVLGNVAMVPYAGQRLRMEHLRQQRRDPADHH
jgi:hypothetical protein